MLHALINFALFVTAIVVISQLVVPLWQETPIFPVLRRKKATEPEEKPDKKKK